MSIRTLLAASLVLAAAGAFAQDAPPPPPPGGPGAGAPGGPGGPGGRQRQPRVNGEVTAVTADSITVKMMPRNRGQQGPGAPTSVTPPAGTTTPPPPPTLQVVKITPQTTYVDPQQKPVAKTEVKVGSNVMVRYTPDQANPANIVARTIVVMPPTLNGTLVSVNAKAVTIRDAAGKYQVLNITPTTRVMNNGVTALPTDLKTNTQTFVTYKGKDALMVYQGTPPRGAMGGFGGQGGQGGRGGQGGQGGRGGAGGTGSTIAPPIDTNSPE